MGQGGVSAHVRPGALGGGCRDAEVGREGLRRPSGPLAVFETAIRHSGTFLNLPFSCCLPTPLGPWKRGVCLYPALSLAKLPCPGPPQLSAQHVPLPIETPKNEDTTDFRQKAPNACIVKRSGETIQVFSKTSRCCLLSLRLFISSDKT